MYWFFKEFPFFKLLKVNLYVLLFTREIGYLTDPKKVEITTIP